MEEKTLALILGLLVVAVVLLAVFKVNIVNYIKNVVPEYKYSLDKEIQVGASDALISGKCPVPIGTIIYVVHGWYNPASNYAYIQLTLSGTQNLPLLWDETNAQGNILLDRNWPVSNVNIGTIDKNVVYLNYNFVTDDNLRKNYPLLPAKNILRWLQGAYKLRDSNALCRNTLIYSVKPGDVVPNPIPVNWDSLTTDSYKVRFEESVVEISNGKISRILDSSGSNIQDTIAWKQM